MMTFSLPNLGSRFAVPRDQAKNQKLVERWIPKSGGNCSAVNMF